jgi:hypothetical protein
MMDSIGTCLCILTLYVLFLLPIAQSQPFGMHRLSLHTISAEDTGTERQLLRHPIQGGL